MIFRLFCLILAIAGANSQLLPVKLNHIEFLAQSGKVSPSLMRLIQDNPSSVQDVFLHMRNGDTGPIIENIKRSFTSETPKGVRGTAIFEGLSAFSTESQAPVLRYLQGLSNFDSFESFWISNQIYIKGAPISLLSALSRMPEVSLIEEEIEVRLIEDVSGGNVSTNSGIAWGVIKMRAPEVWETGFEGQNILIGIIDTGVRASHKSLSSNFVGEFGWKDAIANRATPYDDNGHGTHCAGSAVGTGGIGIAPKAKFCACKSMDSQGGGGLSALQACMQWMLCPTDGSRRDCTKAPDIVSNSWGLQIKIAISSIENSIKAWHAAGIKPIFAAGNSGPACQTMGYPGWSPDVIAVGATKQDDKITDFSSRGPGHSGSNRKPEVSAPGYLITSAVHSADAGFTTMSGTSMACPHTAGLVSLMLSKNKDLTFDQIKVIMMSTANKNTGGESKTCGGTSDSSWPNNFYGSGVLDSVTAMNRILKVVQ